MLLTRDEAARNARISQPTLDAAIKAGDVAVARFGRRVLVVAESLNAWIESRTTPTRTEKAKSDARPTRESART